MSNYTKTVDFAAKDTLPSGDSGKIIKGTEFETEFDNISTAIATKADSAAPTFTGTSVFTNLDINGTVQADGAVTVGVDDTGYDVKFFGATSGAYMLWDESADDLILAGSGGLVVAGNVDFNGDLDVDGTTNLDVVDIDGAVDMASTVLVTGVLTTTAATVFNGGFASNAASTITTASAGSVTADTSADDLVVENNNHGGISILTPNSVTGAIYFGDPDDNNAGRILYNHGDDSLTFMTDALGNGGVGAMTIDSSRNVGIGTSSALFDVLTVDDTNPKISMRDSGVERAFFEVDSADNFVINNKSTSAMIFETSDTERLRIDASGNLLVGTTSIVPASSGNVAGSSLLAIGKAEHSRDNGVVLALNRKTSDGDIAKFYQDGADVGSIGSAGGQLYIGNEAGSLDTGILFGETGTTARAILPSRADGTEIDGGLDIGRSAARWKDLYLSGTAFLGSSAGQAISFENPTGNYISWEHGGSVVGDMGTANQAVASGSATDLGITARTGAIVFASGGTAEKMRIDSSGNVGIGTSSPATNRSLHVSSAAQNQARFERTGASTVQIEFQDSTTTNQPSLGGDGDSLTFRTSFTERMRIDASGRVGIGIVPETWNTTFIPMQLGNSGYIYGRSSQTAMEIGNNAYFGGSGWTYTTTNTAQRYIQDSTDNAHKWFNAASGTEDTSLSWSERMRIDASGHAIIPAGVTLGTAAGVYDAAKTLDDYEEGTWTPVIAGGTCTNMTGKYTKVGNQVTVILAVVNGNLAGTSGNVITGLPFTSTTRSTSGAVAFYNIFSVDDPVGYLGAGVTSINFIQNTASSSWSVANFSNSAATYFHFSLTYFV